MESDDTVAKRQKVVHLTQAQQCRQRPDMYIGSVALRDVVVPAFLPDGTAEMRVIVFRLGFISLLNEITTNALDNAQRPGEMRRIDVKWDGERVVVSNDGFALSTSDEIDDTPAVQVAFGWMNSGTNFNQADTGKKANKYTAGRNGVGVGLSRIFYASSGVGEQRGESRTIKVTWTAGSRPCPRCARSRAGERQTKLASRGLGRLRARRRVWMHFRRPCRNCVLVARAQRACAPSSCPPLYNGSRSLRTPSSTRVHWEASLMRPPPSATRTASRCSASRPASNATVGPETGLACVRQLHTVPERHANACSSRRRDALRKHAYGATARAPTRVSRRRSFDDTRFSS